MTAGSLLLCILFFGGWPLFSFLQFHSHRYAVSIVISLALLTFLIGSSIASFGTALHTPLPFYAWLALPYLLSVALVLRRRRTRRNSTAASASNGPNA